MTSRTVNACNICGGELFNEMLQLGASPLPTFRKDPLEAAQLPRYPLDLLQCSGCQHIQLGFIVDDAELWTGDYHFYSSASSPVIAHCESYADWIAGTLPRLARESVVEIAANDGVLLKALRDRHGIVGLGVDPAPGPVANARAAGIEMRQQAFGRQVGIDIAESRGRVSLILANNVLAHVADLHDFISGIDELLTPLGYALFEFQYLGDLLAGNQIDHVYHEHRSFFSLTALVRLLDMYRLKVLSVQWVNVQGGSLRAVVARSGWPDHSVRNLLRIEERWLGRLHGGAFQQAADHIRMRLRDILWQAKGRGQVVAGYGASAKSTTLLNFCDVGPDLVRYFVDSTPTKAGRYTPGTAIPIVSPESDSRRPDVYLLTVWNYAGMIMRRERGMFAGDWLVPIPVPVLL